MTVHSCELGNLYSFKATLQNMHLLNSILGNPKSKHSLYVRHISLLFELGFAFAIGLKK